MLFSINLEPGFVLTMRPSEAKAHLVVVALFVEGAALEGPALAQTVIHKDLWATLARGVAHE